MTRRLWDALPEIRERILRAPNWILGLDFDGTLAPLEDDPNRVRLPGAIRPMISSLARHPLVSVAILSGRKLADIQARVNIPNLFYTGNHGFEICGPGLTYQEPTALSCSSVIAGLAADLESQIVTIPGAFVEEKGLTLSVHVGCVASNRCDELRQRIHTVLARTDHPFQLTQGENIFEVRPRVYWNNGTALTWIKDQIRQPNALVIYVGDDVIDEDAFVEHSDGITIKVGPVKDTAAQFDVSDPSEVAQFLDWLRALVCKD